MVLDFVEKAKRVGVGLLSSFKKGIFGIILGVLVLLACSTSQAPKEPMTSQPGSEIGRYVYWSTPGIGGEYSRGFLDTKRGRVWAYDPQKGTRWKYIDLNDAAVAQAFLDDEKLIRETIEVRLKKGFDTVGVREELEKILPNANSFAEGIRQKEK